MREGLSRRVVKGAGGIAGLLLFMAGCSGDPPSSGAIGTVVMTGPTEAVSARLRPASDAELAIVAPAAVGGKLLDFDIKEIRGVYRGTMEIVCEKGEARLTLSIALAGQKGPTPLVSTERYAIYYSLRGATPEDADKLSKELVTILDRNRAAPAPEGMGAYEVQPQPL